MRILVALAAVFMVSGAVAQMQTTVRKAITRTCQVLGEIARRSTFQCKDPTTGETQ